MYPINAGSEVPRVPYQRSSMLPPFRIRGLQTYKSGYSRDAVIRVSAPEYDRTVTQHPSAALKYLDDDDGELITVGSSLELVQRLQEPAHPPLPFRQPKKPTRPTEDIAEDISQASLECTRNIMSHLFSEVPWMQQYPNNENRIYNASQHENPSRYPHPQSGQPYEARKDYERRLGGQPSDPLEDNKLQVMQEQQNRMHSGQPYEARTDYEKSFSRQPYSSLNDYKLQSMLLKQQKRKRSGQPPNSLEDYMIQVMLAEQQNRRHSLNGVETMRQAEIIGSQAVVPSQQLINQTELPRFPPDIRAYTNLHAFDIDHSGVNEKIWQAIELRLSSTAEQPRHGSTDSSHNGLYRYPCTWLIPKTQARDAARDSENRHTTEDARPDRFLRSIEVPTVPMNIPRSQNISRKHGEPLQDKEFTKQTFSENVVPETTLTPEGRRQAQIAGVQLRAKLNPLTDHRYTKGSQLSTKYQNRWALYSGELPPSEQNAKPFCSEVVPALEMRTPYTKGAGDETPKPDTSTTKTDQTLLQVFEAELSKSTSEWAPADPPISVPGALPPRPLNIPEHINPCEVLADVVEAVKIIKTLVGQLGMHDLLGSDVFVLDSKDPTFTMEYRKILKRMGESLGQVSRNLELTSSIISRAALNDQAIEARRLDDDKGVPEGSLDENCRTSNSTIPKDTPSLASTTSHFSGHHNFESASAITTKGSSSMKVFEEPKDTDDAKQNLFAPVTPMLGFGPSDLPGTAGIDWQSQSTLRQSLSEPPQSLLRQMLPDPPRSSTSNRSQNLGQCSDQGSRKPVSSELQNILDPRATQASHSSTPRLRRDNNNTYWIEFIFSYSGVEMDYTIRCDVESVDGARMSSEFKEENRVFSIYPSDNTDSQKEECKIFMKEFNEMGWALAYLNPCLRNKKSLIKRAVECWRSMPESLQGEKVLHYESVEGVQGPQRVKDADDRENSCTRGTQNRLELEPSSSAASLFPTLEEAGRYLNKGKAPESRSPQSAEDILLSETLTRFPALPNMEPLLPSPPKRHFIEGESHQKYTDSRQSSFNMFPEQIASPPLSPIYEPNNRRNPYDPNPLIADDFWYSVNKKYPPLDYDSARNLDGKELPTVSSPYTAVQYRSDMLQADRNARAADQSSAATSQAAERRKVTTKVGCRKEETSRRPYSEVFSGNGRVAWDTFIRGYGRDTDAPASSNQSTTIARRNVIESGSGSNKARDNDHTDPTTLGKVQECVDDLKILGFGQEADGGVGRLVVYAQAAKGILSDAIDMIEEERQAYGIGTI